MKKLMVDICDYKRIDLFKYHNVAIFDLYDNCGDSVLKNIYESQESILVNKENESILDQLIDEISCCDKTFKDCKYRKRQIANNKNKDKPKLLLINIEDISFEKTETLLYLLENGYYVGIHFIICFNDIPNKFNQYISDYCLLHLIVNNSAVICEGNYVEDMFLHIVHKENCNTYLN